MDHGTSADFVGGLSTLLKSASALKEGYASSAAYKSAGKNAKTAGNFEAKQYLQNAGQAVASSQRDAEQARRESALAISRGVAVAGASGGGVSDPTTEAIFAGLAGQGEYNALAALYNGTEQARGYKNAAAAAQYKGASDAAGYDMTAKAYKGYGYDSAIGTMLSGGATFLEKYGENSTDTYTPQGNIGTQTRRLNF